MTHFPRCSSLSYVLFSVTIWPFVHEVSPPSPYYYASNLLRRLIALWSSLIPLFTLYYIVYVQFGLFFFLASWSYFTKSSSQV